MRLILRGGGCQACIDSVQKREIGEKDYIVNV
jgi:hypothetical protein